MAQRFSRAMELMGWRVPAETEDEYEDVSEPIPAEEPEFTLRSYPGGEALNENRPSVTPSVRRIVTIHPQSYSEARAIGEAFRSGVPVIVNLTEMPDGEARRIVDFAAGLVFGLHGVIERVTSRVFLLSPRNVEVSSPTSASKSLFN